MSPSVHAARVLVQALVDLGVRHVVLAPGSRSAPLAYAVAQAAAGGAGDPGLELHVRIDERAAGFLAVGLARAARAQGRLEPVAVVTTSGTAVANLHPAVLEADHAGLPLLLLTADRPHELRGTGANQTTEQVGLLAPAVRLTLDVPAPSGRPGEDRDLRHAAARAAAAALGSRTGDPGPVHLDLAYREPLVPADDAWPERSRDGLADVEPREPHAESSGPARWAMRVADSSVPVSPGDGVRTVVVAGDGAGPGAFWIAAANRWPLLAEPTSGAREGRNTIPAYRLLLDVPELGGAVQRVVVLGRPTLSRPVQALLARPDVEVIVIAPQGRGWPDAGRAATRVLTEVPAGLLRGNLGAGLDWLARWQRAGAAAARAVTATLRAAMDAGGALPGAVLATAMAAHSVAGDVLVVGASNPIRDLDLVAAWDEAPLVLANRGLAGIDGTLSTAAGVALGLGRPVRAYVGDVTFLHDVGGLLTGPLERVPDLQVVVANDDGGSIFATLEHGDPRWAAVAERVFATPHGADLAALCAGYGVAHRRVADMPALHAALVEPIVGRSVVEVVVDRAGRRDLHGRLADAVRGAVREAVAG